MSAGIISTGKYIPKIKITNDLVSRKLKISKKIILEKTGIKCRYFASKKESLSFMAVQAAKQAITRSNVPKDNINLVICCNFEAEYKFPCLASKVVKDLKLNNSGSFDINANCTGFQIGVTLACEKIKSDKSINNILVIGSALQSKYLDWTIPENSVYFGDGSGAAIVSRVPKGFGLLASDIFTDSKAYEDVRLIGSGNLFPAKFYNSRNKNKFLYDMNGLETWKQVVVNQPKIIKRVLNKAKIKLNQVDLFIFHQANKNLLDYLSGKLKLSKYKTYTTVERYGNTADASIAITLNEALLAKKIKKGSLVLISGVGAGFVFGASLFKWY
jgi:3-oxoacyl-[acyl-carrier-protein] synthase-3